MRNKKIGAHSQSFNSFDLNKGIVIILQRWKSVDPKVYKLYWICTWQIKFIYFQTNWSSETWKKKNSNFKGKFKIYVTFQNNYVKLQVVAKNGNIIDV